MSTAGTQLRQIAQQQIWLCRGYHIPARVDIRSESRIQYGTKEMVTDSTVVSGATCLSD